jgi:non-specific serine/threonine protein kinase/serine/threonine-protein kinase PknK
LHEGYEIATAHRLPRLKARVENERRRLGISAHPALGAATPITYAERRRPVHGLNSITAQVEEATAIRLLLATRSRENIELACTWAHEWTGRLEGSGRRRALLLADRLLVACLAAAGREDEAKKVLASVASICAVRGLRRILPDGGPLVVALFADLRADQLAGDWQPEWPAVPPEFLEQIQASTAPYTL